MDCSVFENRLTELLAGEVDPALKHEAIIELKRHAGHCRECGVATTLVEMAALPPRERDPIEAPDGYWDGFNAAVGHRIDRAPASRLALGRLRLVAAAAVVLALASGWLLRGWLDPGPEQIAVVAEETALPEWSELEEVIRQASPEELASALRGLPGGTAWALESAGIGGEWVPGADELDEFDQLELLHWLDQMDQADGRPTS